MDEKRFQRRIEDFICEHCGAHVEGDGYTNHCPVCLWSKHVDENPGDRAATCGAMMEPIAIEGSSPDYIVVHRCIRCGIERRNKITPQDSTTAVLALVEHKVRTT